MYKESFLKALHFVGAVILAEDALDKIGAQYDRLRRGDEILIAGSRRLQRQSFVVRTRQLEPVAGGSVRVSPAEPLFGSWGQPAWTLTIEGDNVSSTVSSNCFQDSAEAQVLDFWRALELSLVKTGVWRPNRPQRLTGRAAEAARWRAIIAEFTGRDSEHDDENEDEDGGKAQAAPSHPEPKECRKSPRVAPHIRARAELIRKLKSENPRLSRQGVATKINNLARDDQGLRDVLGLGIDDMLTIDDIRNAYRAMARSEGPANWRWNKGERSY